MRSVKEILSEIQENMDSGNTIIAESLSTYDLVEAIRYETNNRGVEQRKKEQQSLIDNLFYGSGGIITHVLKQIQNYPQVGTTWGSGEYGIDFTDTKRTMNLVPQTEDCGFVRIVVEWVDTKPRFAVNEKGTQQHG